MSDFAFNIYHHVMSDVQYLTVSWHALRNSEPLTLLSES